MLDLVDYREEQPTAPRRQPRRPRDLSEMRESLRREGPLSVRPSSPPSDPAALALLEKALAAAAVDDEDATEIIYREIDRLLREDAFATVDAVLEAVQPSAWAIEPLLAFVSITCAARDQVAWSRFLHRVREHLATVDPTRADGLLAGWL